MTWGGFYILQNTCSQLSLTDPETEGYTLEKCNWLTTARRHNIDLQETWVSLKLVSSFYLFIFVGRGETKETHVDPINSFYQFSNKKYIHTETILQNNFKMKKSCYNIKQTKIEPRILSPCSSSKDSPAKDRASLQVFEEFRNKSHGKFFNKRKKRNPQQAPECKIRTIQVSRTIHVWFFFFSLNDDRPPV